MNNSGTRNTSGQSNEEMHGCPTEEVPISRIRKYTKPWTTFGQSNEEIQGRSTEVVTLNRTTEQEATCRIQKNPPSSSTVIKVCLTTLMLIWPLFFLCFGILYFHKCPAQDKLPLVAIMTACAGTLPIVARVIKIICLDHLSDAIRRRSGMMLMILEGIFMLFFCPYNAMLFYLNPSYDSTRHDYCSYSFYNFNYKDYSITGTRQTRYFK
ncbi:hypothetical protein TNIN_167451 [Trichonephila inaurata madagascariensis]|uniref:Uncharacterized protein n=1 Tax=Trichonephila inaurata madagascariensis TaxID=2747483 RepID=A0A8X6YJ26_9ARAC|nr:hypothetical protein TNIN_167451 [Trichonephila inaurata madagascariensis]